MRYEIMVELRWRLLKCAIVWHCVLLQAGVLSVLYLKNYVLVHYQPLDVATTHGGAESGRSASFPQMSSADRATAQEVTTQLKCYSN
jgi:hypothetical protein